MQVLSPGTWHRNVPTDPMKNIEYRRAVRRICRRGHWERKAVMRRCREDIVYWINVFCYQYNPNAIGAGSPEEGPFILWEFQKEAIEVILDCIDKRRDLVIEKSREMGASWLLLLVATWLLLFHRRKKVLVISRNKEAVDKPEEPDSLFWKVDFILNHCPDWMTGGKAGISRRSMNIKSRLTGSIISGQATTEKAGVGGRATFMFLDEFSQVDEGFEVLARTSDTTGCRIFNGTHKGNSGAFFSLTDPNSVIGSFIRRLVLHWSQHPDKKKGAYRYSVEERRVEFLDPHYQYPPDYKFVTDGTPFGGMFPGLRSPWYDMQVNRKPNDRAVAEDLDINPAGSVSQAFSQTLIHNLIRQCKPPLFQGTLEFDRELARPIRLVPHENGKLLLWINPLPNGTIPPSLYVAGADISNGQGVTPTCLSVADVRTGVKVLEMADAFLGPHDFAPLAVALCWLFKDEEKTGCHFAWERHGPGEIFGKEVLKLGYRNILWQDTEARWSSAPKTKIPGWGPSSRAKDALYEDYQFALRQRIYINYSEPALRECLSFKYVNGHIEHPGEKNKNDPAGSFVNHGDRAMADALACKMLRLYTTASSDEQRQEVNQVETPSSLSWRRQFHARRDRERETA